MNRIVGLETEYGCLADDLPGVPSVVQRVRDWVFDQGGLGLVDLHQRDWDEPAGNGGFLFNGGRVYIDMGHLEYCTPECRCLLDVLRYDRAGDHILNTALDSLGLASKAGFVRNNVDHYSGATFGCHENYLLRRSATLTEQKVRSLLAFLTLRLLYTGAGRVGSTKPADSRTGAVRPDTPDVFQLSQRADYINNDLFEWVQFNRAIINTRDEPLADSRLFRRLHLLHGDTNVLSSALLLKVGTTALILDLLETGALPTVCLADPVAVFHQLSRDTTGPWLVQLETGKTVDATDLLRTFCEAGIREFRGRDPETDVLLRVWSETIASLRDAPGELVGRVDWITKKWLFEQFMDRENLSWGDPWLKSQDLEFHHLQPERGLGFALDRPPGEWKLPAEDISLAAWQAPSDTRARVRSHAMRSLQGKPLSYYLDWEIVALVDGPVMTLEDPLSLDVSPVESWMERIASGPPAAEPFKNPGHER